MNIYQKLIEVRKTVPYLQKENSGYQFKYVSSSQVLASLKTKMDELGLLLIPSIIKNSVTTDIHEKADNNGNIKRTVDYFTELELQFTWVNAEKPEEVIICNWYGQGVDTAGEKGVGKALTYAEKYFMLKFFNIPTDKDDPDSFQSKGNDTPPSKSIAPPIALPKNNQETITESQAKRMFAIAGNPQIVQDLLVAQGYKKSTDVKKTEYDKICKELENRGDK